MEDSGIDAKCADTTIIAFAGRNGCGKGTASRLLAEPLAAPTHTYSDVLYEIHGVCRIPRELVARPSLQALSELVRQRFGQDALARAMLQKCEAETSACVVIDGVRRMEDVEILRERYGKRLVLVWIEASADHRYGRLVARKVKAGEAAMTREAFDGQEQAESERQLDLVRDACTVFIDNDGPPDALAPQVERLVGLFGLNAEPINL